VIGGGKRFGETLGLLGGSQIGESHRETGGLKDEGGEEKRLSPKIR